MKMSEDLNLKGKDKIDIISTIVKSVPFKRFSYQITCC